MKARSWIIVSAWLATSSQAWAEGWPEAPPVERQPLMAQVVRVGQAMERLGAPLPKSVADRLARAAEAGDDLVATRAVEAALDPLCVAAVRIDAEGKPEATRAREAPRLVEQGWRPVLVKVVNLPGLTTSLRVTSPNAAARPNAEPNELEARWLEVESFDDRPLHASLGGLPLEYRIIQLYAAEAGPKTATLVFKPGRREPGQVVNQVVKSWEFDRDAAGWVARQDARIESRGGVLRIDCTGIDPFLTTTLDAEGGSLAVRIRARVERDGVGQWSWTSTDAPRYDSKRFLSFGLKPVRGQWRDYVIPFNVKGRLTGVRLDPLDDVGAVEIESIRITRAEAPGEASASVTLGFTVDRSREVRFVVKDETGAPTTAAFRIEDDQGHVYPAPGKRLAPDFFFHPQVYRADGETIRLPAGVYTVVCSRGPESIPEEKTLTVTPGATPTALAYNVRRWVDPAASGWWSGDHHIHAAGCRHYAIPTEGVLPADMMRHCLGEDLKVGCCLTWGPCFDFQKQFFTGGVDKVSTFPYLLRYDIEVSGFGSHQSGHLCLLRLKDQMYPGGISTDHWPTLGLNTLRWAKAQAAITGPAHSANGLAGSVGRVEGPNGPDDLPDYTIPAYNGIGANEYVVDITHKVPGPDGVPVPAIDFISTMDTDRRHEWNMWYHSLNCGFTVRASGETDFPCITGQRVGLGRVYVKLDNPLDYDAWCEGIRQGRSYVSDGTSHLMDFRLSATESGTPRSVDLGRGDNTLALDGPSTLIATATVATRDPKHQTARVEVVVNGYPVAEKTLPADGSPHRVTFEAPIKKSSWVALRTFPSAHTNPIFVTVGGKPIRASKRSAEWLLRGVDQCWSQKERFYKAAEKEQARAAYEHARSVYRTILAESDGD